MSRILKGFFCVAGGYLGWWLGIQVNMWVALVLSAFGCGLGIYLYRRFLDEYIG